MEVRTDELKAVSRKGLGLFAFFASVCVAVALPNIVVNRVREAEDVRADVDRLCGTEAATAAATAALPFEHLHIAYTVAVENPDVHVPEFIEEFGPLRDGARIALAGIDKVTADLQMQYYVPSPVAEELSTLNLSDLHPESYVPPASPLLRVDTHLVVHIKGAPSAEAYGNPTCYYQQGFGCVCLVSGSEEAAGGGAEGGGGPKVAVDLAASERELERMLRVAYPPAMFEERGLRAAACGVLRSFSDTLLAIERLPLVQEVSDEASAAFGLLGQPGKEAAMRALKHAMRASTHPQLITSTYFPPYHLVAVYLPIFFPIIVSVLIGCVQELKLTKQESRIRAASVTADTGKYTQLEVREREPDSLSLSKPASAR